MNDQSLDQQLALLSAPSPTISLDTVTGWVRSGRQQPRFYPLVWLTRVGWRLPN